MNNRTRGEKMTDWIVHYLWLTKRGSLERILVAVRRSAVANATKQEVNARITALVAEGTLVHHSTGKRPVYRLSDDKADEMDAMREDQRRTRKEARDEQEATVADN